MDLCSFGEFRRYLFLLRVASNRRLPYFHYSNTYYNLFNLNTQKYWPAKHKDPLDISEDFEKSLNLKKRPSRISQNKTEHIEELETIRSNKDVHISQCPAAVIEINRNSGTRSRSSLSSISVGSKGPKGRNID